jgi:hypothetical protein
MSEAVSPSEASTFTRWFIDEDIEVHKQRGGFFFVDHINGWWTEVHFDDEYAHIVLMKDEETRYFEHSINYTWGYTSYFLIAAAVKAHVELIAAGIPD